MNQSPQEILYRRINLLSSLMLAGWLVLSLALAMTAILLHGKSRQAERSMRDQIDSLARQVADLNDRLAGAAPRPPAAAREDQPATPHIAENNLSRPAAPTQPETAVGKALGPVGLPPDPNRPAGLAGSFHDLKHSASPDPENPMLLLITGPKTVDATLAELARLDPAEADRAKISADDRAMAAQLFLQKGSAEQAHRWAAATTQADRRAGRAWLVAGLASLQLKQTGRAIDELTVASDRLPGRPEPLKGLGEAYLAANRPADAIAAYRKAVQAVPQDTALASRLADLLVQARQFDEAMRQLREIVTAEPRLSAQRAKLAQLMIDRNQAKEALAILDAAPDNADPDVRLDLARGQALLANNDAAGAEAVLDKAANNKDGALSAEVWKLLGLARLQQRKNAPAAVALERAIAINSDDPSAWEYLGVALANDGRLDEAIAKLQEAVRLNVSSARMHYALAVLYVWKKQPDAAAASLRQAVQLDKTFLDRARKEQVFLNEPADSPISRYIKQGG